MGTNEDAEKIRSQVNELLADGLTRDEAVQIALAEQSESASLF